MRGIITKVDKHHRTATIQHMVQPPKGKAPSRTIPMSELTLVAKNLPKAIAKAEGIAERIADGKQHDAMDALETIIMPGRPRPHQAFQLGVGTKSMRMVTCSEHEGASERPLVPTYDVFPGIQVNAFSDRSRAKTATLLERIHENTAREAAQVAEQASIECDTCNATKGKDQTSTHQMRQTTSVGDVLILRVDRPNGKRVAKTTGTSPSRGHTESERYRRPSEGKERRPTTRRPRPRSISSNPSSSTGEPTKKATTWLHA